VQERSEERKGKNEQERKNHIIVSHRYGSILVYGKVSIAPPSIAWIILSSVLLHLGVRIAF
jgi:hypothetical protein